MLAQGAVFALEDWDKEKTPLAAYHVLRHVGALDRTTRCLLPSGARNATRGLVKEAAKVLRGEPITFVFDEPEWRKIYHELVELVDRDGAWSDEIVDMACSAWDMLINPISIAAAVSELDQDFADAIEAAIRGCVLHVIDHPLPLLPASNRFRAEAGAFRKEQIDDPDHLWSSALMLGVMRGWRHWATERAEADMVARDIMNKLTEKRNNENKEK
jgi:hypothetical protein